jgi:hypothetical protein
VNVVALFIIDQNWKQSKCSSMNEWINYWHIHQFQYYSAIKRNDILIMQKLGKKSQRNNAELKKPVSKYQRCILSFWKRQNYRDEEKSMITWS